MTNLNELYQELTPEVRDYIKGAYRYKTSLEIAELLNIEEYIVIYYLLVNGFRDYTDGKLTTANKIHIMKYYGNRTKGQLAKNIGLKDTTHIVKFLKSIGITGTNDYAVRLKKFNKDRMYELTVNLNKK